MYIVGIPISEDVGSHRENLRSNNNQTNARQGFHPEEMSRASRMCP